MFLCILYKMYKKCNKGGTAFTGDDTSLAIEILQGIFCVYAGV